MLTFTFQRPRNTNDSEDWRFSDSSIDCYYFIFPVGGGPFSNNHFRQHSRTPWISDRKFCISTSDYFPIMTDCIKQTRVCHIIMRPSIERCATSVRLAVCLSVCMYVCSSRASNHSKSDSKSRSKFKFGGEITLDPSNWRSNLEQKK